MKLDKKEKILLFSSLGGIVVIGVVVMVFLLVPSPKVPAQEQNTYDSSSSAFTKSSTPSAASNTSHDTTVSTSTRVTISTIETPSAQGHAASSREMTDNQTSSNGISLRMPTFSIPVRTYEDEVRQLEENIAREIERLQQYYGVELPEEVKQKRTTLNNSLTACKKQWAAEAEPIKAQLSALEKEKQQVLSQILANAGGQINAEYQAREQDFNTRITALQGQISSIDGKYQKEVEALENQIAELPTEQDIKNMFDRDMYFIEEGYQSELERIKFWYQ